MYIELENQKTIIFQAIEKAGSYRKMSKILNIPRSSIVRYYQNGTIPQDRFDKIIDFLEIKTEKLKFKRLEKNWKQVLGGEGCVKSKKYKGTFEEQLKNAQERGVKKFKEWHKRMKKENPKEYYQMQYNNFKKVSGYKFITKRGHKVRNKFEKQIADILYKFKIEYEYEPLVKSDKKYFFPDFLINNRIIIECTEWRGETKAYKLKDKIKHLKKRYKIFIVIPKDLYRYYKILDKYLIKGLDEFVPVAQTFRV